MEELPPGVAKKEKGRVRFNSDADGNPLRSEDPAERPQNRGLSPVRPRPGLLRGQSYNSALDMDDDDKAESAAAAQERAHRLQEEAAILGSYSAPRLQIPSRRNSLEGSLDAESEKAVGDNEIELDDSNRAGTSRGIGTRDHADTDKQASKRRKYNYDDEARDIVKAHTQRLNELANSPDAAFARESAASAPDEPDAVAWTKPSHHGGVMSEILKLYRHHDGAPSKKTDYSGYSTPGSYATPSPSGTTTPTTRRKWYEDRNRSQVTQANLSEVSEMLKHPETKSPQRPRLTRSPGSRLLSKIKSRADEEYRITIHIADILKRHEYIVKLCRSLMMYGAPTHRLEEYLKKTASVLDVDGQFLYIPECMIISFDDRSTHTAEVKIVREEQGIDLGRLEDVHEIYKEVIHDVISPDEAVVRLDEIVRAKEKFSPWWKVLFYGIASATVGPFAFGGQFMDMPIAFLLGCFLGILQLFVVRWSCLYKNVFEVTATVAITFAARLLGSIKGGSVFCFSNIAQSSIALILPGWLVLSSSLELQSKMIVPGSIRMVYAIIYSLLLGWGIAVGIALYGALDPLADSATTCQNPIDWRLNWLFVIIFSGCLAVVNQAKWKQMPLMIIVAVAGYTVNYLSGKKFPSSGSNAVPIANTLGALTIGILANLYSRMKHGVAAAAMLPAIFVQVPSGLAATGSLVAGLSTADTLRNSTGNGTSTVTGTVAGTVDVNTIIFNVAAGMMNIAIGITVGLFLAALLVYPVPRKRKSGFFAF